MNDKQAYREYALSHRARLELDGQEGERAAAAFSKAVEIKPHQIVAVYLPIKRELDTVPLIDDLGRAGVQIALPVIEKGTRVLKFAQWRDGDALVAGPFDIQEPATKNFVTPDIVVVPMLGFDQRGHRLGYGGGYYDTTIALLRAQNASVQIIGYAYAQQAVLFALPTASHDQKMDVIVHENGILRFAL